MKHIVPTPFPVRLNTGTTEEIVYNEMCSCGHPRSEHKDTLAYGHGGCGQCDCEQFTWAKFCTLDPNKATQEKPTPCKK
jgi:hypothetical protein